MRLWKAPAVVPVTVLLLCTCESFPAFPILPPSAESITAAAALPTSSTVGSELIPSVLVKDASGNLLPRVQVTFAITSGGGAVNPVAILTDDNGRAATQWILGTTAGEQQVIATAGTKTIPFTVASTADVATQIAVNPGTSGQTAAAGTAVPVPPGVIVRDAYFNPRAGVAVTFAVATGGGSVTGSTTTTDARGIATVGAWTLGPIAQTNTLTATSPGLAGSPVTFTATGVGFAGTFGVNAGNNQTATVNSPVNVAPSVVIRDGNNNPVVGASVSFAVASGGGSVTGATTQTNGSGIATVGSWTLGAASGTNTLTASTTFGSATFTATGIAASAATLAISAGNAQTTASGSPVAIPPSVIVRDAFGNPVGGASVTFAVASGGGSVTGSPATTNASGIATVGSWILGPTAGANSLTATSSAGNATFTATGIAGPASQIAVNSGNIQTAAAGTNTPFAPSVIVRDAFGNPKGGVQVTFAVTSGGGSITGATVTSSPDGVARVGSWTLGPTVGTNTLTATSPGLTGSPVPFTATGQ